MEFFVQQFSEEPPGQWAADREAEGWDGFGMYDHWYLSTIGRGLFHPFAVLGAVAATTTKLRLTTTFANNLARSPVEFAQAALTLQYISGGRFEAGLGAGWSAEELTGAGLEFPPPAERARRFKEAITVVRQLLTGSCRFEGEFYRVDLPAAGPTVAPPPLVAALGGAWTITEIGPLVDMIEIAAMAPAARSGTMRLGVFGATTFDELRRLVDTAREANPAARLGLSVYVATGTPAEVSYFQQRFTGDAIAPLAGPADQVADALQSFAPLGFDRITVLPPLPTTAADLAPYLFRL